MSADLLPWAYSCGARCQRDDCEHERHVAANRMAFETTGVDNWRLEAQALLFYGGSPPGEGVIPAVELTATSTAFIDWEATLSLTYGEVDQLCKMLEAAKLTLDEWRTAADPARPVPGQGDSP